MAALCGRARVSLIAASITATVVACGPSGGPTTDATPAAPGSVSTPTANPCTSKPTPTVSPSGDSFCTPLASLSFLPGGLDYGDIVTGTGPALRSGQRVRVQYTGWLQSTGVMFDTSRQPGRQPFEFVLGAGQVIRGWDEGLTGMHVGGKRRLIIPTSLAYGGQGRPPLIPPQASLVFDVEVLAAGF